jgi:acetyltransferase-like isoleucine patch superfamily enzyme
MWNVCFFVYSEVQSVNFLRLVSLLPLIVRGLYYSSFIRLMGGQCGFMLVDSGFSLRCWPHAGIKIGNNVGFGPNVKILVPKTGTLTIGDRCQFTSDVYIAAMESVTIGSGTMVAECSSIRDADHTYSRMDIPIRSQSMSSSAVVIGSEAWIARGVAILKGSHIGSGAVIGANAVVKGIIPDNCVAVGVPARILRHRSEQVLPFQKPRPRFPRVARRTKLNVRLS